MELTSLQPRCKICILMRLDPNLWKELHRKVIIERISRAKALTWLNQRAEILNITREENNWELLPLFSTNGIVKHFKMHIKDFSQVEAYIAAQNMFSPEAKANPAKMALQAAAGTEMDDYLRLESLISASGVQLANYEKTLSSRELEYQKKGNVPAIVNLEEVKIFQKLIHEQMAMKKDLAVLQAKQAVAGTALRDALERVVEVVMNAIQDSMVDLRANLHTQYGNPEWGEKLARSVAYKIGEPLKASIPSILDEVYKKYKIR